MSRRRIAPNEAIEHSPEVSPGVPMAAGRQERPPGTDHGMSRGIARAAFSYRNQVGINPLWISNNSRRRSG